MEQFRAMRRKRQQLSEEESIGILQKATAGTLALLGDGGYPYAVPISYVYADGKLYFHSALSGHKVDAIKNCDKASFCVIDQVRAKKGFSMIGYTQMDLGIAKYHFEIGAGKDKFEWV